MRSRFYGGSLDGQERDDVLGNTLWHVFQRYGLSFKEKYERARDLYERSDTGEVTTIAFRFVSVTDITDEMREAAERLRRQTLEMVLGTADEPDNTEGSHIDHLLHRLWTKAVGTADYDKNEWKALQRAIEERLR